MIGAHALPARGPARQGGARPRNTYAVTQLAPLRRYQRVNSMLAIHTASQAGPEAKSAITSLTKCSRRNTRRRADHEGQRDGA